jgi:hypothetical protein
MLFKYFNQYEFNVFLTNFNLIFQDQSIFEIPGIILTKDPGTKLNNPGN